MESKLLRKIEQDLYKTTERGLNFFREYLNLALFNYLG